MANNELFNEDLKEYDLLQLENWIRKCRTAIKKDDFKDSNTAEEDYKKAVLDFVEEWKEHSKDEKNEDIYKKDDFQKAILANGILLDRLVLILRSGKKEKKIDITEKLYDLFLKDEDLGIFNNLMTAFEEKELDKIDDYLKLIENIFDPEVNDYKEKIVELIRNKTKYEILTYTTVMDDEAIFEIDNVDELIETLLSTKIIEEPAIFETIEKEEPFLSSIYEFDITKQVFYDFKEDAYSEEFSNKSFQKKFFINVGLYLSLNLDLFEMLLNLFGYTVKNSRVDRDRLITDFIYIGLDKEYIDISIQANSLRPLTARVAGYQKRDINYINEFLKKTTYTAEEIIKFRYTLEYAMTKLSSFINHKEEMIKRAVHKLEKLEERIKLEEASYLNSQNELEIYEFENSENEENFKNEISKNRQKIRSLEKKDVVSLEDKKEIDELKERNGNLAIMKNEINEKSLGLNRNKNEALRKLKNTKRSIDNTKNKILRLENTKYKSLDFFKENFEEYNNLTLLEIKDLLESFEILYNKDY